MGPEQFILAVFTGFFIAGLLIWCVERCEDAELKKLANETPEEKEKRFRETMPEDLKSRLKMYEALTASFQTMNELGKAINVRNNR